MNSQQIMKQVKEKTIEVDSFQHVDISDLKCPIIAIYINPEDYQEAAVARLFDLDKPTNIIMVRETAQELRNDIMNTFPGMVRFDRAKNDPRSIIETWL